MKHNLQNLKAVRYIGIVLLVLVFALVSSGTAVATPPEDPNENTQESQDAISRYLAAQDNPALSDEEKIKAAIDAYFTLRYEGRKALVTQDFSPLLEDDTLDWVKAERDKREIELYIAILFNLRYEKYTFTLDYDSIEIKGNEAVIRLRESHTVVFSAIAPVESKISNLRHTITLHFNDGIWTIYQDEYKDIHSRALEHMTVEEIKKVVNENYQQEQKNTETPVEEISPDSFTFYNYNRTAAVNYAHVHVSDYNDTWYKTEENEAGNLVDCANFVSQALYAGGWKAPPDQNGMISDPRSWTYDWYYVYNDPPGTETGSGSLPWIQVGPQYTFLTNNTDDIGPRGSGSTNYCTLDKGDIVQLCEEDPDNNPDCQLNTQGAEWFHEGIVVEIAGPTCVQMGYYLVNAHSDYEQDHYPISEWTDYYLRYIHITGYRLDTTGTSYFSDVPKTHWGWQDIQQLYAAGFTAGCATNPLRYCPTNNVTRAEMAIFLLRGYYDPSYVPPTATGIFSDVPTSHWAANWIEQLYRLGITGGCGTNPLRYCPENLVTHAQMSIFLLRSKYGSTYNPPPVGDTQYFSDVPPSHWAAKWINELAFEGLSYGKYNCIAGWFCPDESYPITRAEMASMLVRTFINLP